MSGSRYEEVAERIRTQILDGTLSVGERLPVESSLAADFGVSRSTIREALRVLGSEGLIRTTRGVSGGSFVLATGSEAVSTYLEGRLGLLSSQETISGDELLQTRALLETSAAALAAERRTGEHLRELRDALEQELGFHTVLLATAQNRLLELMTAPVLRLACERLLGSANGSDPGVAGEHELILQRIEAGDAEGAASATAEHLERLRAAG